MSTDQSLRAYHVYRQMAELHAASLATSPESRQAHTRLAALHADVARAAAGHPLAEALAQCYREAA